MELAAQDGRPTAAPPWVFADRLTGAGIFTRQQTAALPPSPQEILKYIDNPGDTGAKAEPGVLRLSVADFARLVRDRNEQILYQNCERAISRAAVRSAQAQNNKVSANLLIDRKTIMIRFPLV